MKHTLLTLDYDREITLNGHSITRLDYDLWLIDGETLDLEYALYAIGDVYENTN